MEERTAYIPPQKRYPKGALLDNFHSVQFALNDMGPIYLFRLRDIPSNGLCILVKEDSTVLEKLEVGDILDMQYNIPELPGASKLLKTQVTAKNCHDGVTGHALIGLSIIDK